MRSNLRFLILTLAPSVHGQFLRYLKLESLSLQLYSLAAAQPAPGPRPPVRSHRHRSPPQIRQPPSHPTLLALQMLQALGARVDGPQPAEFNGLSGLELWPRVTWSPLFAASWDELAEKVDASGLHIGADATLVIQAPNVRIKSLDLQQGTLVIAPAGGQQAADGGAAAGDGGQQQQQQQQQGEPLLVDGLVVRNAGWQWRALGPDDGASEEEYIRGFRVVKAEQQTLAAP